jgi:hypothetical protein
MFHDPFFWAFIVESVGYLTICALIGRAIFLLRNKPAAKTPAPPQPGSLKERMQQSKVLTAMYEPVTTQEQPTLEQVSEMFDSISDL